MNPGSIKDDCRVSVACSTSTANVINSSPTPAYSASLVGASAGTWAHAAARHITAMAVPMPSRATAVRMTDMPPHNDAGVDVSHQELVRAEFSRQAEAMASAPAFSAAAIIDRFKDAIASKASGVMLDLACGPAIL